MTRKRLEIRSDGGMHPRWAELLADAAGRFASDVWLEHTGKRVNAKSVICVQSLKLRGGDGLVVSASGPDESQAVAAVARLVEKGEA